MAEITERDRAYPGKGDPWADFLHHRARVLEMFASEGKTPADSAAILSMDATQVMLILAARRGGHG